MSPPRAPQMYVKAMVAMALLGAFAASAPMATAAPGARPLAVAAELTAELDPLKVSPECGMYGLPGCNVRYGGRGTYTGGLIGTVDFARSWWAMHALHGSFPIWADDNTFTGTLAGCGEGTLRYWGSGAWELRGERLGGSETWSVESGTGGLAGVLGSMSGSFVLGPDGKFHGRFAGTLYCPASARDVAAERRTALRAGRRCSPRRERSYRRRGFTCRKRGRIHRLHTLRR